MRRAVQAVLRHPALYLASQRALGATRARFDCVDELDVKPGQRVLDVGCGPAYYLDRMPAGVEYHGFDTDAGYLEWARRRFGGRGQFTVDTYTEEHRARLPPFDRILLMGLLHHLDDATCTGLLDLLARSLAPGGIVVTLDTCMGPSLNPLENWLARHDRGQYVREPEAFRALASQRFGRVEGHLVGNPIPLRLWLMKLRDPRPPVTA